MRDSCVYAAQYTSESDLLHARARTVITSGGQYNAQALFLLTLVRLAKRATVAQIDKSRSAECRRERTWLTASGGN